MIGIIMYKKAGTSGPHPTPWHPLPDEPLLARRRVAISPDLRHGDLNLGTHDPLLGLHSILCIQRHAQLGLRLGVEQRLVDVDCVLNFLRISAIAC
jgi:hypothetical protein